MKPNEVRMALVTCTKCGWVHSAVSREHAENEVAKFNEWFEKQPQETKDLFGGKPASVREYEGCMICGRDKEVTFRPFKEGDCPDGCTINPTIWEEGEGE